MNMKLIDKAIMVLLLLADIVAVIVGMFAGPLGHQTISLAASYCSAIVSACIVAYFIILWKK